MYRQASIAAMNKLSRSLTNPVVTANGQIEFTSAGTFNWTVPAGVTPTNGLGHRNCK